MTNELTLNGNTYDLTDRDDVVKALNAVKEIKEKLDDCGCFTTFVTDIYNKIESELNDILASFPPEDEESIEKTENMNNLTSATRFLAKSYLTEHIGGFEDLDDDQQESFINLISKAFTWLMEKESEVEE